MATTCLNQDIGQNGKPLSRCQSTDRLASKKGFITATKTSKGTTIGKETGKMAEQTGSDTFRGVKLSAIPMLPESINLSYLAEGAANIIYRFSLPHGSSDAGGLQSGVDKTHLLRLRKALPSGSPNLPAFAALQQVFFPLFPKEFILDTRIVRIPEGLIERENATLKQREVDGDRNPKRVGLYLVGPPPPPGTPVDDNGEKSTIYERYAFLVEDMTPTSSSLRPGDCKGRREVLIEFKPKWLVQSPGAPQGSRRCRTCALRIAKEFKKHGTEIVGNGTGNPGHWCPFDLVSGDAHRVRLAVRGILSQKGAILTGWKKAKGEKGEVNGYEAIVLEDKIVRYFTSSKGKKLLDLLKEFQSTWDPHGPAVIFGENGDQKTEPLPIEDGNDGEWGDEWTKEVKKYLMAMTIRDLTLFLKVELSTPLPSDPGAMDDSVQARIGDLDLKSPENGKAKYWIGVEEILREGGWYTGTEQTNKANGHRPPVSRKVSSVGDKRKHAEVEGEITDGRRIGPTGEPVEVVLERERDEEGLDGVSGARNSGPGNVRWCIC